MSAFQDITGQRRNKLTALWPVRRVKTPKGSYMLWMVACECGKMFSMARNSFGKQVSCGCVKRPKPGHITHGLCGTGAYSSWQELRRRCLNRNNIGYADYGGRGIKVCERWASFAAFFADMGTRPAGMTLDRINNDGNYEPGNCKWSTPSEQAKNRRPKVKHVCWSPKPLSLADIRAWRIAS